jgi:hypothetical protein
MEHNYKKFNLINFPVYSLYNRSFSIINYSLNLNYNKPLIYNITNNFKPLNKTQTLRACKYSTDNNIERFGKKENINTRVIQRRLPINTWVKNNYTLKNLSIPRYNPYFIFNYVLKSNIRVFYKYNINNINIFMHIALSSYKNNDLIKNLKYYYYFKNTPNILLINKCVFDGIINGYTNLEHNKYELISLYHYLGDRLINYYFKFMYTLYDEHFENLSKNGLVYSKFKVYIDSCKNSKIIEFDYYLSFTEFKNLLMKGIGFIDTEDVIKYGQDMYLFTIYNLYLYNYIRFEKYDLKIINQCSNVFNIEMNKCKSLVKRNIYKKHILSGYCPSKNEVNKRIVKLNLNNIGMYKDFNHKLYFKHLISKSWQIGFVNNNTKINKYLG